MLVIADDQLIPLLLQNKKTFLKKRRIRISRTKCSSKIIESFCVVYGDSVRCHGANLYKCLAGDITNEKIRSEIRSSLYVIKGYSNF